MYFKCRHRQSKVQERMGECVKDIVKSQEHISDKGIACYIYLLPVISVNYL